MEAPVVVMEFSTTARILMCPPDYFGIEYEINPWMNMQQGTNPQPVRRQWQRLYQTLCDLGAAIDLLEPIPGLPDLVFTANAGLVFHDMFLPRGSVSASVRARVPISRSGLGTAALHSCRYRKA